MPKHGRWRYWSLILFGYAVGIGGISGLRNHTAGLEEALVAFVLPSTATVMYLSVATILARDTIDVDDKGLAVTYDRILFGVVLFVIALHVTVITALAGVLPPASWLARAPIVLFGLLGIWVGNLLPRTRPNLAFGIRTRRTLWDRSEWMRTHRLAGHAAVVLGTLFVISGAFFSKHAIETVVGPVALAAGALLAAAHLQRPRSL